MLIKFLSTAGDIKADYEFLREEKSSIKRIMSTFLFNPGFRSIFLYRIQAMFTAYGSLRIAQLISGFNLSKNGAEFCVGARIASPTIIRHPSGIVIGGGVDIGPRCTILQGVTLGRINLRESSATDYPKVGSHVVFGAYCAALGNIIIVNETILGAHSVLLNSALKKGTYVGIPAKLVKDLDINE
jgi:serine O-acetyltransferase